MKKTTKGVYTVKERDGKFWVITPSGKTVAVAHDTRWWANTTALVFNHTMRDENTVVTLPAQVKSMKDFIREQRTGSNCRGQKKNRS